MAASAAVEQRPKTIDETRENPDDSKTKGSYIELLSMNKSKINDKKNLVLDQMKFEAMFLTCQSCKQRFGHDDGVPKIIPCHHSFCFGCLKSMFKKESDYRMALTGPLRSAPAAVTLYCPVCRNSFIATMTNLTEFPTDHRIVQLLDFIGETDVCTTEICSEHEDNSLNFFCEVCVVPVCRECAITTHREEDGHVLKDLNEALDTFTPQVDASISELTRDIVDLTDNQDALEKASSDLAESSVTVESQINESFDQLRAALNERESRLLDLARERINVERERLNSKVEHLRDKIGSSTTLCDTLKEAREDMNIEALFRCHHDAQERKKNVDGGAEPSDDETTTVTTFSYTSRDDKNLAARISTFGDIATHTQTTSARKARNVSTSSNR